MTDVASHTDRRRTKEAAVLSAIMFGPLSWLYTSDVDRWKWRLAVIALFPTAYMFAAFYAEYFGLFVGRGPSRQRELIVLPLLILAIQWACPIIYFSLRTGKWFESLAVRPKMHLPRITIAAMCATLAGVVVAICVWALSTEKCVDVADATLETALGTPVPIWAAYSGPLIISVSSDSSAFSVRVTDRESQILSSGKVGAYSRNQPFVCRVTVPATQPVFVTPFSEKDSADGAQWHIRVQQPVYAITASQRRE